MGDGQVSTLAISADRTDDTRAESTPTLRG